MYGNLTKYSSIMKISFKTLLLCATMCMPVLAMAQDGLTDAQLSEQYKKEINVKNLEIKTLKAKMKADPKDASLSSALAETKAQLEELKSKKKIIDANISAQKAAEKAEKKLKAAQQKAEKAAEKAESVRKQ